jgi:hypothetical protein
MKKTLETIGSVILIAGIIIMALAFITSIGMGLYWWAHTMALPQAAWSGFMVWVKMIGIGFLLMVVGLWMSDS